MKAVIFTIFLITTTYAAFQRDAKRKGSVLPPPKVNADTIGELILGGSKAEKDQGNVYFYKNHSLITQVNDK